MNGHTDPMPRTGAGAAKSAAKQEITPFLTEVHMQKASANGQVSLPSMATGALADRQHVGEIVTAVQLLRLTLDTFMAKDIKGWAELCDVNVVVEFPFAPDKALRKVIGRTSIYEFLKDYPSIIDLKTMHTMDIYATDDPHRAIAEWSVAGEAIGNGNPYEVRYATFVTFRNGLIVHYRQYCNRAAYLDAINGTMF